MSDQAIEKEIQAKGKTAARVTPDDIEANIVSEHYFTGENGVIGAYTDHAVKGVEIYRRDHEVPVSIEALSLLTFCVLVLRNGFTVTGESACISPENFDTKVGRKIARENAVQKVWPLLGFALKERLHAEGG